ncbi:MAG: glycosyltransferase family 4 protein [Bdellovibrionota bacterium]
MNSTPSNEILWVAPKWPLPVEDGARQATYHLVRALSDLGVSIHFCAIIPEGETVDPQEALRVLGVRRVSLVRRAKTSHWRSLLRSPLTALTVAPYSTAAVARQMDRVLAEDSSTAIVFDGLHAAGWIGRSRSVGARQLVYRAHNVEANLWSLGAKSRPGWLVPLFLRLQGRLIAAMEKALCRKSALVAAVSDDDVRGLTGAYGEGFRAIRVAIGMDFQSRGQAAEFPRERALFFIGRLDWKPNREGLEWFLQNVWPEAAATSADLRLRVAGAGDGSWLERYRGLPRLEILGRVPEVAEYYRSSTAALVPVFYGSGTRVKAIEASSYSRACISTQLGVEGIGLDERTSYFRAETREQWLELLRSLTPESAEKRGKAAFECVRQEFDPKFIATQFIAALNESRSV